MSDTENNIDASERVKAEEAYKRYCFLGFLIAFGLSLVLFAVPPIQVVGEETFSIGLFAFLMVLVYLVLSWRFWDEVKEDEVAALFAFGVAIKNLDSGVHFAPPGLTRIRRAPRNIQQREFPAEPELVYRGDEKTVPEDFKRRGYKPPIRVPFTTDMTEKQAEKFYNSYRNVFRDKQLSLEAPRGDDDEERTWVQFEFNVPEDGIAQRVTAEPSYIIRFRVKDPISFFRNIGSVDEVFRQLEDELTNIMFSYFAKMSLAQALVNLRWMNMLLYKQASKRIEGRTSANSGERSKSWGITLESVTVKMIHLSHELNTVIGQAAQAPFKADALAREAKGKREQLILEGEGRAQAARDLEEQTLAGRAAGIKILAEATNSQAGAAVQAAEVAREVAKGGNTIVVGTGGMSELAGLAAAAANIVQKQRPTDKEGISGDTSPDESTEPAQPKGE